MHLAHGRKKLTSPNQHSTLIDAKGDGEAKPVGYDTTGDGLIDAIDSTGDGKIDKLIGGRKSAASLGDTVKPEWK